MLLCKTHHVLSGFLADPSQPTELKVSDQETNSFVLKWKCEAGHVDYHMVHIDPQGDTQSAPVCSGTTFEGLSAGRNYSLSVTAVAGLLKSNSSSLQDEGTCKSPISNIYDKLAHIQ